MQVVVTYGYFLSEVYNSFSSKNVHECLYNKLPFMLWNKIHILKSSFAKFIVLPSIQVLSL